MGVIFDIQYYCMYDGPGIRTCVFLKGCPLSCAWCHNPESWKPVPEIGHMAERCAGCGKCAEACGEHAVVLVEGRARFDRVKCTACGDCVDVCPNDALEMIGQEMSAADVAAKVLRDKEFYDGSGGGATITGGEATLQRDFLLELLRELKSGGVHTALETSGFFKPERLEEMLGLVDLFLFDIKHVDPELHKRFTGVSTDVIKTNFREILRRAGRDAIVPRIPLIPGFNADGDSIGRIIDFLQSEGYSGDVELMPYNPLAKTKWGKIGRADSYSDMGELGDGALAEIVSLFEEAGFQIICNK